MPHFISVMTRTPKNGEKRNFQIFELVTGTSLTYAKYDSEFLYEKRAEERAALYNLQDAQASAGLDAFLKK